MQLRCLFCHCVKLLCSLPCRSGDGRTLPQDRGTGIVAVQGAACTDEVTKHALQQQQPIGAKGTTALTFSVSPCGQLATKVHNVISLQNAGTGGHEPASRDGGGGLSCRSRRAPGGTLPRGLLIGKVPRGQGQLGLGWGPGCKGACPHKVAVCGRPGVIPLLLVRCLPGCHTGG